MKAWVSMRDCRRFSLLAVLALLVSCGQSEPDSSTARAPAQSGPQTGEVIDRMLEQHGGVEALREVETLVKRGEGTRGHFGQIPETGGRDPVGTLTNLVEVIDLANGQAAFDNSVRIGEDGFAQERTEVLMNYQGEKIGWGTTNGRPNHVTTVNGLFSWASHNSPEWLLRRNVVSMLLAGLNADRDVLPMSTVIDGNLVWVIETMLGDESVDLYVDQDTQMLAGWHSVDTETMRGDTEAVYSLSDYREVAGVMLPHHLVISKTDGIHLDVTYENIEVNPEGARDWFELPAGLEEDAQKVLEHPEGWVSLEWVPVTEHTTHIVAFSHHSMVVEFPDYVVVVEGPYTEAQSITLARQIDERLGKPIRSVVPTHPHYDHTGGLRAFASMGANVLTAGGHEDEIRGIIESPHSNPPDVLAERLAAGGEVGQVEVFNGMTEISEEGLTLQLFEVGEIPHVEPMVLAYVPEERVLFQSDLFFGAASPDAEALYSAITQRGLDVEYIVGGHGDVLPFTALEEAVGQ